MHPSSWHGSEGSGSDDAAVRMIRMKLFQVQLAPYAALNVAPDLVRRGPVMVPVTGTVCEALAAMRVTAAAEVLATGLSSDVLRAWVKLATVELAGECAAIVTEVFAVDPDAVAEALDKVWSAADWQDECAKRAGEPVDQQTEDALAVAHDLRDCVDAYRHAPDRVLAGVAAWIGTLTYDGRLEGL